MWDSCGTRGTLRGIQSCSGMEWELGAADWYILISHPGQSTRVCIFERRGDEVFGTSTTNRKPERLLASCGERSY